jgi:hypothetical protein
MTESLLSTSNILLFGRVVEDLTITRPPPDTANAKAKAATVKHMLNLNGLDAGDGTVLAVGDSVLVLEQENAQANGIYVVGDDDDKTWTRKPPGQQPKQGSVVEVSSGSRKGLWRRKGGNPGKFRFFRIGWRQRKKLGKNRFLDFQLEGMIIARIYGFSYEGAYYDLPKPILFGVHGEGEPAVLASNVVGSSQTNAQLTRAPREPSISGVGAADFGIADDIRVWSYDKADYTIRMDVETGMFEQVLLDACLGEDGPYVSGGRVSGGRVAGGRVSGGRVSGGRVSGGRVSGGRVSGGRGDPSD